MKQPTPNYLIAIPGLIIESKIALWGFEKGIPLTHSQLKNIYKPLNISDCKRVLKGHKRLITAFESDYQNYKINGIAPIGRFRI